MKIYNVLQYGAVPDSEILQTEAIQNAIDVCFRDGGGKVEIPAGVYRTGGLLLKSRVTLWLRKGAVLKGSRDPAAYFSWKTDPDCDISPEEITDDLWKPVEERTPESWSSQATRPGTSWNNGLLRAVRAEDVAVIGEEGSVIDGSDCYDPQGEERYRGPHGMSFWYCRNITLRGYTVENAGNWAHALFYCEGISMHSVTCLAGHDGIHLTCCTNASVTGSSFYTGDDCIAGIANTNVYVENCVLNSACSAFRFGGTNLFAEHCRIFGPCKYFYRGSLSPEDKMNGGVPHPDGGRANMLSVFTYYADYSFPIVREQGNLCISDCEIENADRFLHYNYSGNEPWQKARPLSSVSFRNVRAKGIGMPLTAWGDEQLPVFLSITDSEFAFREGCGEIPFLRMNHTKGVLLSDVRVSGCGGAPFILTWEKDPCVILRNVIADGGLEIGFTEEPFVCGAI